MGMFLPEGFDQKPVDGVASVTPANPETTADDIALMQRVLSAASRNPNLIPSDFMAYLIDYVQTSRLSVPIGQVFGYQNSVDSIVAAALAGMFVAHVSSGTTSCSSVFGGGSPEVDTAGPSVVLADAGSYLILASFKNDSNFPDASHNELVPSVGPTVFSAHVASTSVAAVGVATGVAANTTITSTMKLCVGGSGSAFTAAMSRAQIVALRYA